jgi:hypothetical protein
MEALPPSSVYLLGTDPFPTTFRLRGMFGPARLGLQYAQQQDVWVKVGFHQQRLI